MKNLYLNGNGINFLNSESFDGLQNLELFSLWGNEISDLPANAFVPLKNLQQLSLRNNRLTTIHSDSFGVHNNLTIVWLECNEMNAIDEKFIDNSALSYLDMGNNICSQSVLEYSNKTEMKAELRKCFENYSPRPVEVITCGKPVMAQGNVIGGTQIVQGSFPW